jgi:predicted transposase YbfD/YdcC
VAKEVRKGKSDCIERENRDDVTNLHGGRLQPVHILAVVRAHWAIENHGNWTVDVIWDEDSKVWCGQGVGIHVLS